LPKLKLSKKQEFEAEIRNKLTMPLTILNRFMHGKHVPKKSVELAIRELEAVLRAMKKV